METVPAADLPLRFPKLFNLKKNSDDALHIQKNLIAINFFADLPHAILLKGEFAKYYFDLPPSNLWPRRPMQIASICVCVCVRAPVIIVIVKKLKKSNKKNVKKLQSE